MQTYLPKPDKKKKKKKADTTAADTPGLLEVFLEIKALGHELPPICVQAEVEIEAQELLDEDKLEAWGSLVLKMNGMNEAYFAGMTIAQCQEDTT